MSLTFDVIIIGAGPAGIFAARELAMHSQKKVLLLEKGRDVNLRSCPLDHGQNQCMQCKPCSIMSGWGGAGAFSDGKLTLTTAYGGWLDTFISHEELETLIDYADAVYVQNGAPDRLFGTDPEDFLRISQRIAHANLKLLPAKIRHMGTDNTQKVLSSLRRELGDKVCIKTDEFVEDILVDNGALQGVSTSNGTDYFANKVICAPGREGAAWFSEQCRKLGIPLSNNQVDLGVRVEIPSAVMQDITEKVWEPKIIFYTKEFDDVVRTFCVNPSGHVVMENTNGIVTVNGHSYANSRSNNTNFALLVSQEFTEPFDRPILYGRCVASLANMLSGSIIVQRYGDLKRGRRSTKTRLAKGTVQPTLTAAVPGDLSLVLPHRFMVDIMECLEALDVAIPGIASDHTLLYGIEAKFYSARPQLTSRLQTPIDGLWAVGDGAGVSRGLIQASVSGVIAARDLMEHS